MSTTCIHSHSRAHSRGTVQPTKLCHSRTNATHLSAEHPSVDTERRDLAANLREQVCVFHSHCSKNPTMPHHERTTGRTHKSTHHAHCVRCMYQIERTCNHRARYLMSSRPSLVTKVASPANTHTHTHTHLTCSHTLSNVHEARFCIRCGYASRTSTLHHANDGSADCCLAHGVSVGIVVAVRRTVTRTAALCQQPVHAREVRFGKQHLF